MALNFLGVFPINDFKMLSSLCTVYTLQISNFTYLPGRFFPKYLLVPKCKLEKRVQVKTNALLRSIKAFAERSISKIILCSSTYLFISF